MSHEDQNVDISLAVKALILQNPVIAQQATVVINRLPQGIEGASICLWIVGANAFNHLGGSTGLDQSRVQLDAYADEPAIAAKLSWLLWRTLDGFAGVVDEVHILGAMRLTAPRQLTDRVLVGTDQYRFVNTQDFRFTFNSLEKVTL